MEVVLFNITPYKKNGSHFSAFYYSCVSGKIKIYLFILFIYLFLLAGESYFFWQERAIFLSGKSYFFWQNRAISFGR